MADESNAPDWSLLPGKPTEFFGLREGFERNDLKRAYNALIKVFKPERHPQEFQRIRAAYEQLDEQLRYGHSIVQQPVAVDWTEHVAPQPEPAQVAANVVPPRPKPLVERLRSESPKELFAELKAKPNKSPYDYYALALMSDVVERTPLGFAHWLVEGIEAHPSEVALQQLLHAFFRGPQRADQTLALLKLLPKVARAMRTDNFYPLTEAAWLIVLRERPFHEFERLLADCEAELRDAQIAGKMVFTIQLVKSAMWRDPTGEWSRRQCEFIDSNFEQIPHWLEWEVDLLAVANDYLSVRCGSMQPGTLRHSIDESIITYFSEPQHIGDRAVLATQVEILKRGDELLSEFPLGAESDAAMFMLWNWMSADVATRHLSNEEEPEVDQEIWVPRGRALIGRLSEKQSYNWSNIRDMAVYFVRWGGIAIAALVLFSFLLATGVALGPDNAGFVTALIIGTLFATATAMYYLVKYIDKRYWHPWLYRHWERRYHALYRRELLDFQQRSRVPGQFFRALIDHLSNTNATSKWINVFVQQDYSFAFLAIAQRFEV